MRGVLVTNDLMSSSRLVGAAQMAGRELVTAMHAEALGEHLAQGDIDLVVLDLSDPATDVAGLVAKVRAAAPTARIVAFGPHVAQERLAAAAAAGCDLVLPRGQIAPWLASVL